MSQLFASGGQRIGASASASVPPMNIQDLSPLGWTGWISLQSKGLSESSPAPQFRSTNSSVLSFLYGPALTSTCFANRMLLSRVLCCAVLHHSVVSDSLQPHELEPARLLCPWDSPGKNARVGCHALLQGIFPTQGLNPGLPHGRCILYHGSPIKAGSFTRYLFFWLN